MSFTILKFSMPNLPQRTEIPKVLFLFFCLSIFVCLSLYILSIPPSPYNPPRVCVLCMNVRMQEPLSVYAETRIGSLALLP